eukprot:TRINITY_DN5935_c0_g1_i1.p1 TRINITY_DN5935_c0_g1~~TRINITY_DN5935_c0_g1_i1.p1  ORF type:complete len:117 (+),score=32.23 TRINITY_DN5935_c0_g1_i1:182-532(+)
MSLSEFEMILPKVVELLKVIKEKGDPHAMEKEAEEGLDKDVDKKINDLTDQFHKCFEQLNALPGMELTRDEQEQLITKLSERLTRKCELLAKYESMSIFQNQSSTNSTSNSSPMNE